MRTPIPPVTLDAIEAARTRLPAEALNTPLLPLELDGPGRLFLKLESLQPIGSFKLRGAGNAMARLDPATLSQGVYTASAGNMAQGVAWNAQRLGVPCTVIVPEHAPQTKLEAIRSMGARIVSVAFDEWWQVIMTHTFDGATGTFIHPVSNPDVIAGNGTVGLEIVEQLPEVDTVVVPYGGGGLSCGIASALKGLGRTTPVYASEVETSGPLSASLEAGRPVSVDRRESFVDGIGGRSVLEEMWPLARDLLAGAIVVSLEDIAAAIRLLATRAHIIAEGAGASSVAAARTGRAGEGTIVCVISGGNIDFPILETILRGKLP